MTNFILNSEQEFALRQLEMGENVFLTGGAGTGKTTVIRKFIEKKNGAVMICAPTGIAAINIGGATIHKNFRLKPGFLAPQPMEVDNCIIETLMRVDTIVFDEVGMIRFDIFYHAFRVIQYVESLKSKKIQVVVLGDFFQLGPVIPRSEHKIIANLWGKEFIEGYAFQTLAWQKANFKHIELSLVERQQDREFVYNLEKLRKGDRTCIPYFNANSSRTPKNNAITICTKKSAAKAINDKAIEKLDGAEKTYTAREEGIFPNNCKATEKNLLLKVGMRVMVLCNDSDNNYINGSTGVITSLNSSDVEVQFDSGITKKITAHTWENYSYEIDKRNGLRKNVCGKYTQIPLQPSYCITIHKAQGLTFSEGVNMIQGDSCFLPGQLYTALSRVREIKDLYLSEDITESSLITSETVKNFYKSFQENAA